MKCLAIIQYLLRGQLTVQPVDLILTWQLYSVPNKVYV